MKTYPFVIFVFLVVVFSFNREILAEASAPKTPPENKPKIVEIYTLPDCPWCKKTCELFSENNVDFIEYDITALEDNRKRFDELGSRGVPLIIIGDNRILGYNKDTLKKAILKLD